MKKFLKISAIVLAVFVAIIVAVPALLSGKIGDIVKSEANKMLNAKVEFEKLDISLISHFPKASLELVNFSVTGINEFEGVVLVAGECIEVAVDVLSLFGESFEISKVWLLSPQINGVIAKDGKANWDIMKPSEPEVEVEEPSEESESTFKLSINSVNIENGAICYDDNQGNMHFKTFPVSLSLSGDLSAAATTLYLKAAAGDITFVTEGDSFASGLTMALDGAIAADFETNRYTLSKLNLSVNSVKAALDGWVELAGDDIVTDITLDCSDNNFKSILSLVPALYTKDFKDLTASGDVSLTGAVKGRLSGDNYPAFNLNLDVAKGSFKYADLPKSVSDINIVAAVANKGGSLDATTVNIPKFTASFGGQTVAATLKATTPLSDLGFDATLKGKINLGAIKDIYPLEDMALEGIITADAVVAGHMSDIDKGAYDRLAVNGQLGVENIAVDYSTFPTIEVGKAFATLSPSKMALESLEVKIGNSDISASGNLTNYWGYLLHDKTLSGRLSVKSQLLDLNELMASISDEEESTEEQPTEQPAEESTTAIEVPKNLNLILDCNLKKMLYDKMVMENFVGTASVKDGVLSLDNLGMDMFDGKAKADASYSTTNIKNPRLRLDANFSQASFKKTAAELELVEKLVPLFEQVAGNYTMSLKCDMSLDETMSPELKSVNGSGKITSGNFSLSDVPAFNMLSKLVGNGVDLNKIDATEITVISFEIKDGNVITKPFDIKLGKTKLTLSGLTGLDQSIDYNVAVALPQMTLHGKIGGTFSKPKVSLDTAKSVEAALEKAGVDKEAVEQKVEQVKEQVKEQVTQTVDDAKQKAIAEAEAKAAQIIETAQNEANKLVEKASNPIAKIAAKAAADKLIAEAEKQAQKIIDEVKK